MFIGTINDKPTVRVSADDNVAPWDLSPTDYGITRVNTDIVEIGYAYHGRGPMYVNAADAFDVPNGQLSTWINYPLGSSNAEREGMIFVERNGNQRQINAAAGPQIEATKPVVIFRRIDRSSWTSNWTVISNTGGGFNKYMSYPNNLLSVVRDTEGMLVLRWPIYQQTNGPFMHVGVAGRRIHNYGNFWRLLPWFDARQSAWFNLNQAPNNNMVVQRHLETELPLDNSPYPAIVGSPVPDKTVMYVTNQRAAMAKPGFDLATASGDELIFDSDRAPIKVARTGFFTIAPSQQINIDIDYPITPLAVVHDQISFSGNDLWIPPRPNDATRAMDLEHRIVGQQLQYRNTSADTLDCRYVVFPAGEDKTVGTAPVWERIAGGHYQLRSPGTAGTADGDIIVDTRCAYLPIVKQGYIPKADLTLTSSNNSTLSTHMLDVTWENDGSWKPFVIAAMAYSWDGKTYYQHFVSKRQRGDDIVYFHSTFMARVTDTSARFYFNPNPNTGYSRPEDKWDGLNVDDENFVLANQQAEGLRYYILAVPNSL